MVNVSVITPIYNVEKYLCQCLDSLSAQTLSNIEFICVNDGSTDNSLKIVEGYAQKDKRFHVINQPNGGYGKAMNTGLHLARGKYIGILESDDFADRNMFKRLFEAAEKNDAEITKSSFYWYTNDGEEKAVFLDERDYEKVLTPRRDIPTLYCRTVSIWSAIYRKDFLEKYGINFNETPGASYQDVSFFIETISMAERVYFIGDALLYYRSDNEASSVKSRSKVDYIFQEFNEGKKFLANKYPLIWGEAAKPITAMKYTQYLYNYWRVGYDYKLLFLRRMMDEIPDDMINGYIDKDYFCEESKWIKIKSMIDKPEGVYLSEFTRWQEARLAFEGLAQELQNIRSLYIYGAGKVGNTIAKWARNHALPINGIIVSSMRGNPNAILGVPVYELKEKIADLQGATILVAIKEASQFEIISKLENISGLNIISMTNDLREALRVFG